MEKLSERLKFILEKRGVTRYELAQETGICESTLSRIMSEEQTKIHKKTSTAIANYLRISEKWLRSGVGTMEENVTSTAVGRSIIIPIDELWCAYQNKEKQLEKVISMLEDQIKINDALRAKILENNPD